MLSHLCRFCSVTIGSKHTVVLCTVSDHTRCRSPLLCLLWQPQSVKVPVFLSRTLTEYADGSWYKTHSWIRCGGDDFFLPIRPPPLPQTILCSSKFLGDWFVLRSGTPALEIGSDCLHCVLWQYWSVIFAAFENDFMRDIVSHIWLQIGLRWNKRKGAVKLSMFCRL